MQRAGRKAVIKFALAELKKKTKPSGRLQHNALKEVRQRYEKYGLTENIPGTGISREKPRIQF